MHRQASSTGMMPKAIVVMGVSGSGKSTLGALLAIRFGCPFLEGDELHSEASIAKMRAGRPLTDDDRWPWLDRVAAGLRKAVGDEGMVVAACSALKRSYRDRLTRGFGAPILFVVLRNDEQELTRRLGNRRGHYMPPALLGSQLRTLELPGEDECAIVLDSSQSPDQLGDSVCALFRRAQA